MIQIKHKRNITHAISGLLIAVVIFGSSIYLANMQHNLIDQSNESWNFQSGLSLSGDMEDRNNEILSYTISAHTIENQSDTTMLMTPRYPFYDGKVASLGVSILQESNKIRHWLQPKDPRWIMSSGVFNDISFENEVSMKYIQHGTYVPYDVLARLGSSTEQDIADLGDLVPVSDYWKVRDDAEVIGADVLHINVVYKDGSFLRFRIINNLILVLFSKLDTFISSEEDGTIMGPIKELENFTAYKGYFQGSIPLDRTIIQINAELEQLVKGSGNR